MSDPYGLTSLAEAYDAALAAAGRTLRTGQAPARPTRSSFLPEGRPSLCRSVRRAAPKPVPPLIPRLVVTPVAPMAPPAPLATCPLCGQRQLLRLLPDHQQNSCPFRPGQVLVRLEPRQPGPGCCKQCGSRAIHGEDYCYSCIG